MMKRNPIPIDLACWKLNHQLTHTKCDFREAFLRIQYELGMVAGESPILYSLWRRLLWKRFRNHQVFNKTEIVIEGFPRSANTFAVRAFRMAQPCPRVIAKHTHKVSQVAEAVARHIPTVIMIREPAAVAVSMVIRNPYLLLSQVLRNYIRFYTGIAPYRDGYVLAPFDEVIRDFGKVISRINSRFGTSFALFEHTQENLAVCRHVNPRPGQDSQRRKIENARGRPYDEQAIRGELYQELDTEALRPLLQEAREIYQSHIAPGAPQNSDFLHDSSMASCRKE